jgi:hypothetical protein
MSLDPRIEKFEITAGLGQADRNDSISMGHDMRGDEFD